MHPKWNKAQGWSVWWPFWPSKLLQFQCPHTVHEPLLDGPGDVLVLDLVPPPELHLLLGSTNRIFDALNAAWGEDKAFKWAIRKNIVRSAYRGGSMEGPSCKKVLEKALTLVNGGVSRKFEAIWNCPDPVE